MRGIEAADDTEQKVVKGSLLSADPPEGGGISTEEASAEAEGREEKEGDEVVCPHTCLLARTKIGTLASSSFSNRLNSSACTWANHMGRTW